MRISTIISAIVTFQAWAATAASYDTHKQGIRAVGKKKIIQAPQAVDNFEFSFDRVCDTGQPYGCYQGYCWKSCGDIVKGEWCWTSKQPEKQGRLKCKTWLECGDLFREFGCVKGDRCTCGIA
jgi:hypothetical protein